MIITLCGSSRFEPWFHAWNEALSLAGHCVFGLTVYPSQRAGLREWYTPQQKYDLDQVHRRKIQASAAVVVLNPFAYLGKSTLAEIKFTDTWGLPVYFLESWGKGHGISGLHNARVRDVAARYGVPVDYGSPIHTSGGPYIYDLLGPASDARSALVDLIHEREALEGLGDAP